MANVTDAELSDAKARWQQERASRPIPVSVRYDGKSGRIVVDFENGAAFMVPARSLEGLAMPRTIKCRRGTSRRNRLHWNGWIWTTPSQPDAGYLAPQLHGSPEARRPRPLPRKGRG